MEKMWLLLKESDGQRGVAGKKKAYEVRLDGTTVHCSWGMAEKAHRARSVHYFGSEQAAYSFALEKVYGKQDRGYKVACSV